MLLAWHLFALAEGERLNQEVIVSFNACRNIILMTLLAPFALFGLLLLSVPIVVHLFKPRKMKQTPFSSLRWLKATHQRLSRRIQWHQWLLFLLRAGCIVLLVLALAKPLVGNRGVSGSVDRVLIVDASRSMAYRNADLPTPWNRAVDLAEKTITSAKAGDRTAVVLSGTSPRILTPLSADASPALASLKATAPSLADAPISATLPLVRSLLPGDKQRPVEIVFLTNHLKQGWQQKDVQAIARELPEGSRVTVIDTSPGAANNAWIADARLLQFGPDEDRWIRVEIGCVGDVKRTRSVQLTGIAGLEDQTQELTFRSEQTAHVNFRIPANLRLQSQITQLRLEPGDALTSDDVYFLNLDAPWSLRVLLIEPESPGPDGRNTGLFLHAALKSLTASKNQAIDVVVRTASAATASDMQKADIVLLAGVPELNDSATESLEKQVRAGAGLAVFLGSQCKPAYYHQKLHRASQPAEGLLPIALKKINTPGQPGVLTNIRWTHPLLAPLADPVLSDFTRTTFLRRAAFDGSLSKQSHILARFDDAEPAIIEHPLGAGRVLLFNTSANDEWSDLPRRKAFLPLVDRTLAHLSATGLRKNYFVGDTIILPVANANAGKEIAVVAPSGAKLAARILTGRGTLLRIDPATEAGVYRLEIDGKLESAFTVNARRSDSPMNSMDNAALQAWWSPASVEVVTAEDALRRFAATPASWPMWPLLVILAAMFLIAEAIYVHRLCPRANPKAADGVVPQRGVLRSVGEAEVSAK